MVEGQWQQCWRCFGGSGGGVVAVAKHRDGGRVDETASGVGEDDVSDKALAAMAPLMLMVKTMGVSSGDVVGSEDSCGAGCGVICGVCARLFTLTRKFYNIAGANLQIK